MAGSAIRSAALVLMAEGTSYFGGEDSARLDHGIRHRHGQVFDDGCLRRLQFGKSGG